MTVPNAVRFMSSDPETFRLDAHKHARAMALRTGIPWSIWSVPYTWIVAPASEPYAGATLVITYDFRNDGTGEVAP